MSTFGEPIDVASLPLEEQYRFYREVIGMTDEQASWLVTISNGVGQGDVPDPFATEADWIERDDSPTTWSELQAEVE